MKRLLLFFFCFALLILPACSSKEAPPAIESIEATAFAETTAPADLGIGDIKTDENLLTVELTLPATLFEDVDIATYDFDAYADEQGFIRAIPNEDGTVSIKMTKSRHKEFMDELTAELESSFADLVDSEDTPYIKGITHNDDFSEITIKVVRADYEKTFDFSSFLVALSARVYQAFLDMEFHVDVTLIDVDTGEIISIVTYPDALVGSSQVLPGRQLRENPSQTLGINTKRKPLRSGNS